MEDDNDYFKISCNLTITSEEISVDEITEKLGISPHRFYRKGEEFCSRHSGTKGKRVQHLWAISSSDGIYDYENVEPALDELRYLLKGKEDVLLLMKNDAHYYVSLTIWIETNYCLIGMDLPDKEIALLNLVNNVHFTFIPNKEL